MLTTNHGMQLVCILLSLLFFTVMDKSFASSNREQKYELDLIHEQIGFLLDENQIQNHEIDVLKKLVRAKDYGIRQLVMAKEQQDPRQQLEMDGTTRHPSSSENVLRSKRPARLLPNRLLYGEHKNQTAIGNAPLRFYGPPTNCSDLAALGYTLNGFYTVTLASEEVDINSIKDPSKLQTVYCSFNQPVGALNPSLEKRIPHSRQIVGPVETGIHFHVTRTYSKEIGNAKPKEQFIQFNVVHLNKGDVFVEKNGPKAIFLAPKSGVYQFAFTSVMASIPKNYNSPFIVNLVLNGPSATIGNDTVGRSSTKEGGNSMAIAATLKLKKGDRIFLEAKLGPGSEIRWASFSGSLLEAEEKI